MSRVTDVLSTDVAEPGRLRKSIIAGSAFKGYEISMADGKPATLAVVDADGNVIESGPQVPEEAWVVAVLAYQRFLEREGQLHVISSPGWLKREKSRQGDVSMITDAELARAIGRAGCTGLLSLMVHDADGIHPSAPARDLAREIITTFLDMMTPAAWLVRHGDEYVVPVIEGKEAVELADTFGDGTVTPLYAGVAIRTAGKPT